jgi:hypothetical protein
MVVAVDYFLGFIFYLTVLSQPKQQHQRHSSERPNKMCPHIDCLIVELEEGFECQWPRVIVYPIPKLYKLIVNLVGIRL